MQVDDEKMLRGSFKVGLHFMAIARRCALANGYDEEYINKIIDEETAAMFKEIDEMDEADFALEVITDLEASAGMAEALKHHTSSDSKTTAVM